MSANTFFYLKHYTMTDKLQTDHMSNLLRILDISMNEGDHARAATVARPLLRVLNFLNVLKDRKLCAVCNPTTTTNRPVRTSQRRSSRRSRSSTTNVCERPFPEPRVDESERMPCDLVQRSVVEMLWNTPKVQFLQVLRQLISLDFTHRKYIITVHAYLELKNLDTVLSEFNISKSSILYALQGLKSLRKNHPKRALKTFTEAEKMAVGDSDAVDFFKICRAAANRSTLKDCLNVKTMNPSLANTLLLYALEESGTDEENVLELCNRAYVMCST